MIKGNNPWWLQSMLGRLKLCLILLRIWKQRWNIYATIVWKNAFPCLGAPLSALFRDTKDNFSWIFLINVRTAERLTAGGGRHALLHTYIYSTFPQTAIQTHSLLMKKSSSLYSCCCVAVSFPHIKAYSTNGQREESASFWKLTTKHSPIFCFCTRNVQHYIFSTLTSQWVLKNPVL